ncbi:hypothetical protein GCM10007971_23890 [Oceanobacillus indicireducens]|uniref:Uncharacterized protein n=1 Tax=Oceanobacillus indicireducens TaxID=1004261 RepID=A0A918D2R0_9BACI|nr:hypothetical protein GCM10007971_23890 [Oceanobacillus indicireducens]
MQVLYVLSKFVIEKTAIWTFDENYLKTAEFKVTCNDLYKAKKAAPKFLSIFQILIKCSPFN